MTTGKIIGVRISKVDPKNKRNGHDLIVRNSKTEQVEVGKFTTVQYAVVVGKNYDEVVALVTDDGEFIGMDQMQANLVLKTKLGIKNIARERIISIKQDDSVAIEPGAPIDRVPSGK